MTIKIWCIVTSKQYALYHLMVCPPKFQPDFICKIREDLIKTEGVMLITRSKLGSFRNQGVATLNQSKCPEGHEYPRPAPFLNYKIF